VHDPKVMKYFINNYIKPHKKMFIGSNSKDSMTKFYGNIDFYIQISERNCYEDIDIWWPEIERNVGECKVVLPAAGVATKVIAKRLWDMGHDIYCFDIGSLNDAIEGRQSRVWIEYAGVETLRKNLL